MVFEEISLPLICGHVIQVKDGFRGNITFSFFIQ